MAETKKTAAAKPSAKAVETKKEETSAAPVVKEAPKAEAKKTTTRKTSAKKAAAKPAAAKRTTVKKAAVAADVHVEFSGRSYAKEDLVKIAQDIWQYDLEKKPEDFKTVSLYVKMEENKVYYVINDEVEGSFAI